MKKTRSERNKSVFVEVNAQEGRFHGWLSCSGCPGKKKFLSYLKNERMTDIVTLLKETESSFEKCILKLKNDFSSEVEFHHFPLSGRKLENPQDEISLRNGVIEISNLFLKKEDSQKRVMVHCAAGQHRTGVFSYVFLRYLGFSEEETLELIKSMRFVTYTELIRDTRRNGILAEKSERVFKKLFPLNLDES